VCLDIYVFVDLSKYRNKEDTHFVIGCVHKFLPTKDLEVL